jgi:hypothetical protein
MELPTMIPKFMLKKLYVKDSLKKENGSFSFQLKNNLYPGTVIAVEPLKVNDREISAEKITISFDETTVNAHEISKDNPFELSKGTTFTFEIKESLSEEKQKIKIAFTTKEAGKIDFEIEDEL